MLDPRLEDFDKDAFMASLKESMGMCAEEKLLYQKLVLSQSWGWKSRRIAA